MLDLKKEYKEKIVPELMKEFNFTNPMMAPKLLKVVVNRGAGEATVNPKILDTFAEELQLITGQKPLITKAKKSISTFKIREGLPIGCKVTLRGSRMWDFLSKLINIVFPKVRDFKGINKKSFDGRGNYTIGIKEQIIFPEISFEKVAKISGMDITICTSAKNDKEAYALLDKLGMPFRK